jgi:galactokinase
VCFTSIPPQGVLNNFFREGTNDPIPVDMLVSGTVPAGSGLSSSAAMVVASTLSFLVANDNLNGLTKGALVEIAVANENRVGVNSGG